MQRKIIWHAAVKKGKDLRVSSSDGVNQPCATKINGARQVYSSGQSHFLVTCVCASKAPLRGTETATEGRILIERNAD